MKNIIDSIKKSSFFQNCPSDEKCSFISIDNIKNISYEFEKNFKEIEIIALENGIIPTRYARNFNALSSSDQIRLLKSKTAIVGLGGLGGSVSEMLARIGAGELILIDGDKFDETNLNRQALSSEDMINSSKVKAAEKKIKNINSSVIIKSYEKFINEKNAGNLIKGADVVIDCLDNLKTRFILEKACKENLIPLVSGAIAGTMGQILSIFPEDKGFEKLYGNKKDEEKGAETYLGALSFTVNMTASIEVSEAVKIILNKGKLLRNELMVIELTDNMITTFKL